MGEPPETGGIRTVSPPLFPEDKVVSLLTVASVDPARETGRYLDNGLSSQIVRRPLLR